MSDEFKKILIRAFIAAVLMIIITAMANDLSGTWIFFASAVGLLAIGLAIYFIKLIIDIAKYTIHDIKWEFLDTAILLALCVIQLIILFTSHA